MGEPRLRHSVGAQLLDTHCEPEIISFCFPRAGVAQLVEHLPSKQKVTGSNPASRLLIILDLGLFYTSKLIDCTLNCTHGEIAVRPEPHHP